MNGKGIGLFAVAALVLSASLAIGAHIPTPPISDGGELAYVRDYPDDALDTVAAGGTVTATYVAWNVDQRENDDLVEAFTSRGRAADTQVWHQLWLPAGVLGDVRFEAVDQYEQGLVVAESERGCVGLLNGVNAGVGYYSKGESDFRLKTTGQFDPLGVSDTRAELHRDGHVIAVETLGNATLSVEGVNVNVDLGDGGQVRTWIDGGAFPATTTVMHSAFDHMAEDCATP